MDEKIVRRMERVFKGVANHNRVKILEYIAIQDKTTLWQISQGLDIELKNTSQHTARMEKAGLIEKQYIGREVFHTLTLYGQKLFDFIKTFKNI